VASQFVIFLVAGLIGTASVGGLRSVQVLFAPFALLGPAVALPGLPAIVQTLRVSETAAWQAALKLSLVLVVLAVSYFAFSLLWGERLLSFLLGRDFGQYGNLILPIGAQQVLAATSAGFFLLLKAARRGKAVLLYRLVASGATVIAVTGLAIFFGLAGAAWGVALGTAIGSLTLILLSANGVRWRALLARTRSGDLA
jgi:O-antigen/teichoic acid export membrane protein